jgi:O-antigen ligase
VLVVEVVLAHGLVGSEISKLVYLFVAVVAGAVILRFPMATALGLLFFVDFIFYPNSFAKEVGPMSIRAHEVALAALLALALIKPKRRTWGGTSGKALAVFLVLLLVSDFVALGQGSVDLHEAISWSRPFYLLTMFYVVVRLFPAPSERRILLLGGAILGAATGVVALAASFGGGISDALKHAAPETIRQSEGAGALERVRLPGLAAGYSLFWYAAAQIDAKSGRRRIGWALLLLGIATDIVISFNRNMWIGILIGLVLMATFGGAFLRGRLTAVVGALVAGVLFILVFGGGGTGDKVVEPLIQRGGTLFNLSKTKQEGSVTEREEETSVAWKTAKANPLLGVGAGASYGMLSHLRTGSESLITGEQTVPQLFLHNQYLYLVLVSGVFGFLAFVIFLGAPLVYALRRVPKDPAIAACGVGIAIIMISAVVAIYFSVESWTAMLGLLTGVIVADREGRVADGLSSGLLD